MRSELRVREKEEGEWTIGLKRTRALSSLGAFNISSSSSIIGGNSAS
jgi:hypothetical protein